MAKPKYLLILVVALLFGVTAVEAAVYTIPVLPGQNLQWWHFYYFGADNGWLGPGSGDGASYYYDAPPAYPITTEPILVSICRLWPRLKT